MTAVSNHGSAARARDEPSGVPFVLATVALGGLLVAGLLIFGGAIGSVTFRTRVGDSVSSPLAAAAAAAAGVAAVRSRGRWRWAWALLGLGLGLWAAGETVWLLRRVIGLRFGSDGIEDTLYLAGMAPVIAGTALFPVGVLRAPDRLRVVLDAITVAGAILFLAYGAGLFPRGQGSATAQLVDLAYPAGDVAMLCVAVMVLLRATRTSYLSLGLMVTALFSYAIGDSVYAVRTAAGTYSSGTLLDLTWNVSYGLFVLAALAPGGAAVPDPDVEAISISSYRGRPAPWLLLGLVMFVTGGFVLLNPRVLDDPVAVAIGAVVTVTFSVRQVWVFTDLRRMNDRLTQHATRTERMAEAVVDGILVVDRRGRVIWANTAAGELLRAAGDVLLGLDIAAVVDDASGGGRQPARTPGTAVLDAVRTRSSITQAGTTFRCLDGSSVPVDLSVGPLDEVDPAGVIVVFRDASVRRAVEQMKNEFMSVISHEVRTPLTSIRGALALLAGGVTGELTDPASRMVGIALESSERLSRLINDILDVERLESGTLQLELAPQPARGLVEAAVREMGGLAPAAQVQVVVGECHGVVTADADRVVQVLTNLIGNAIKFSPVGAEVTVGASPVGGGESATVEFWVLDHGRGIPASKLESIFDRFEQVDSSDSRQKGGTGLGLAICRDIVRLHGGRIWVRSELGAGAEFRFGIPSARAEGMPHVEPGLSEGLPPREPASLTPAPPAPY